MKKFYEYLTHFQELSLSFILFAIMFFSTDASYHEQKAVTNLASLNLYLPTDYFSQLMNIRLTHLYLEFVSVKCRFNSRPNQLNIIHYQQRATAMK